MNISTKLLKAAAGSAGGAGLDVDEVFSTFLYDGNGEAGVIENGIALGNEGDGGSLKGGTGTWINVPASSDFGFGTGDFTIECFFFMEAKKNYNAIIDFRTTNESSDLPVIYVDNTPNLVYFTTSARISGSIAAGQWYHIAVSRSGTSTKMFLDGTQLGSTFTDNTNYVTPTAVWSLGAAGAQTTYEVNGFVSNVRVVKGTALYTSNFTAPTSALTAVTNTKLLTLQGSTPFVDNSSSSHTLTQNGSPVASDFGPFTGTGGEGGAVWIKRRDGTGSHAIFDTVRGRAYNIQPSGTDPQDTFSSTTGLTSFNSNGFSLGAPNYGSTNSSSAEYVSWTFRKAPKFFDVVTWTGNGANDRAISHNLEVSPAILIIKRTDSTSDWAVKSPASLWTGESFTGLYLNKTDARGGTTANGQGIKAISSTDFTVISSGSNPLEFNPNVNNATYVAYLFAHNNNDGGFGEPGDQDIIKCDTYDGNGNNTGPVIDLGFEPQWVMIKREDTSIDDSWIIHDNMRGIVSGGNDTYLLARTNGAENSIGIIDITSTGFKLTSTYGGWNNSSGKYVYMAIRRGGMQTPTAASSVFAISEAGTNDSPTNNFTIGFDADMNISTTTAGNQKFIVSRLLGNSFLKTNADSAETSQSDASFFGGPTGTIDLNTDFFATSSSVVSWSWARARGYFDVVTTKSTNGNVNHNLGVAPEMVWYKRRDSAQEWYVCTAANGVLKLNTNAASAGSGNGSYLTNAYGAQVTSTTVNTGYNFTAATTADMIIYLFATVAGVSKVGLFTQSGATNVACGFTGDTPALIIYKRTDGAGNWHIYDSVRGIVAGNDAHLFLDTTDNEQSSDYIDPYSGGFATTSGVTNGDYIFYAIAATS